ncbi:MAG: hypothetical protein QGH94_06085 [Phycisphaerae bacterium]|jgi:hypothetical protein|nr:hypothetical protein [Phycisphaerae bacterium]
MRTLRIILLLAVIAMGQKLYAQTPGDQLQARLAAARAENATLKKLVSELNDLSNQLNADLAVQRQAVKRVQQEKLKAAAKQKNRELEYKLALAENKMLKARIKSLIRSARSSTSKPAAGAGNRKNVRYIEIELREELWKWWTDPILLSEHISLRRKLVHLDVDHSVDAWLTRRREFAGTNVNWTMRFVSGAITSKKKVDQALKQADKDLSTTLQAAVYGSRPQKPVDNAKYLDGRIAAQAATQPAPKPPTGGRKPKTSKTNTYSERKTVNHRKQIRQLQERIELYKLASAAGGLTTIYAVSGDIAVKIAIPGRHFENVSRANRPKVQIKGSILSAAPKAGYFIGRTDTMMQFVVTGKCTLKNPPAPEAKPE